MNKMNKKWIDVSIGEYNFTVRCIRSKDCFFGNQFAIEIFPQHKHPTTFWERVTEFWKYPSFNNFTYHEILQDEPLYDWILERCKNQVEIIESTNDIENQWNNL